MEPYATGSASVLDEITEGPQAIAVDPDSIATKPPTKGHLCGRPSGSAAHRERGERSCTECLEAAADAQARWEREAAEREDAERAHRAATLRPSMATILTLHGVKDPDAVVEVLAKYGYGDHADALLNAARECPTPTNNTTTGGNVKAWLRGRAAHIRKEL